MTTNERDTGSEEGPVTAQALRQSIAENQAAKVDEAISKRAEAEKKLRSYFDEFMKAQITQDELDEIRRKVLRATENSEFEVQVFRFPSKLCTDKGRAINNNKPDWPQTLQGKARNLYDLFEERGRPQGFKLKAQILDYPGGVPGDVGVILNWE